MKINTKDEIVSNQYLRKWIERSIIGQTKIWSYNDARD